MDDKIITHNLNDDQVNRNPPSPAAADDLFEFFRGGLSDSGDQKMRSHGENIIFCGKLIPINQQLHRQKPPFHQQNHPLRCRRSRSESRSDVKSTTTSALVIRNSRSVGYKKLRWNSSMSSEPAAETDHEGSAAGSGKKSSYSRWHVFLYGLVNVPTAEMNIRDLKNRQVRVTTSKTRIDSPELLDAVSVSRSVDRQKCSWRVFELLSCKSSSAVITMPLSYMANI